MKAAEFIHSMIKNISIQGIDCDLFVVIPFSAVSVEVAVALNKYDFSAAQVLRSLFRREFQNARYLSDVHLPSELVVINRENTADTKSFRASIILYPTSDPKLDLGIKPVAKQKTELVYSILSTRKEVKQ